MKILLLADINSSHTQKWVIGLDSYNMEVQVFSLNPLINKSSIPSKVKIVSFFKKSNNSSIKEKMFYVFASKKLTTQIKSFRPNYVHAHYASSYGILGRMSKFSPLYISVWGSDVFDFPKQNPIFKAILQKNFNSAQRIFSSSSKMAKECELYTDKTVEVIPFGVDLDFFKPQIKNQNQEITLGIIKSLESIYAIDNTIKAIKILTDYDVKLNIIGSGSKELEYRNLAIELGVANRINFKGKIPHSAIVKEYQEIDIFINVSHHESFGVSIIEASACEKPVIVNNVGGMPEIVIDKVTGILIDSNSPQNIANAIINLIDNPDKMLQMGKEGRKFIYKNFNWQENLKKMISFYSDTV